MGEVTHLRADQEIGKRIWWDEFYCPSCAAQYADDEYFSQAAEPLTALEAHNDGVILVCDDCECDLLPIVYTID